MKGSELRSRFLDFFKSKGHTVVSSSSLVPHNDPTLLFTNAGMNQFKECFLGAEKRPYVRAATCQKSMRVSGKHNDLENIGVTARHHTFFEMLGNFSFGDYFKKEAIAFAWEFITKDLGLSRDRLWVTIFEEDDEAGQLWASLTDVLPGRILKMGAKDNFWSMGDTGPCGPCTEIHYYMGDDLPGQSEANFRLDDGSYLEIWNLVFMQFDRTADGKLVPLPAPSVDTGMGLERITSILQGVRSNYDTDLLRGIISKCEELSGHRYDGSSFTVRDLRKDINYARDVAMRVIADHSRAVSLLIADGVTPGSEGRGYVLRRVLRRAVRHGQVLKFSEPFLKHTCDAAIAILGVAYPELVERRDWILKVVDTEERKFHETLSSGLSLLQKEADHLSAGELFPGKTAFLLHDTYGFPLDLTQDALKPYGLSVDEKAFATAMSAQRTRSREERRSRGITFTATKIDAPKTEFIGYTETEASATLVHASTEDGDGKAGSRVSLVFNATPFYAESGGQVGDTGVITLPGCSLRVDDTQKILDGYFVHSCEIVDGAFTHSLLGSKGDLRIDTARRARIRANHSATHLVHSALRTVLGTHVKQAGSRVDEGSLRFDYSHFEPVTEAQMREIQLFVNDEIRANHEVTTKVMGVEEAKKSGAMALFGEKYGDKVRVIEIGPRSLELCGGTHVTRSGDIGFLMLAYDNGISSGVRRIECWAGAGAEEELLAERAERNALAALLKTDAASLPEKIERLLHRQRELEREIDTLKSRIASSSSSDLMSSAITTARGVRVICERVAEADTDTLKGMVDTLRNKLGSGVVVLAAPQGDSAIMVAGVTADLTTSYNAGSLVKEASKVSGGRGGGRADFAQAGGLDPSKLQASLERCLELISA